MENIFESEEWIKFRKMKSPLLREVYNLALLQKPNDSDFNLGNFDLEAIVSKRKSDKVDQYLERLDFEDVKIVQTVMYIGRDINNESNKNPEGIYKEKRRELDSNGWNEKSIEIRQITGKGPLDSYLKRGLELLGVI